MCRWCRAIAHVSNFFHRRPKRHEPAEERYQVALDESAPKGSRYKIVLKAPRFSFRGKSGRNTPDVNDIAKRASHLVNETHTIDEVESNLQFDFWPDGQPVPNHGIALDDELYEGPQHGPHEAPEQEPYEEVQWYKTLPHGPYEALQHQLSDAFFALVHEEGEHEPYREEKQRDLSFAYYELLHGGQYNELEHACHYAFYVILRKGTRYAHYQTLVLAGYRDLGHCPHEEMHHESYNDVQHASVMMPGPASPTSNSFFSSEASDLEALCEGAFFWDHDDTYSVANSSVTSEYPPSNPSDVSMDISSLSEASVESSSLSESSTASSSTNKRFFYASCVHALVLDEALYLDHGDGYGESEDGVFDHIDFGYGGFEHASLEHENVGHAKFEPTDFENANLEIGNFENSDLDNSGLDGSDLEGSDLESIVFENHVNNETRRYAGIWDSRVCWAPDWSS